MLQAFSQIHLEYQLFLITKILPSKIYKKFLYNFFTIDLVQEVVGKSSTNNLEIKTRLTLAAPILARPDFSKPSVIQCNTSDTEVCAVLYQECDGLV